MVPPINAALASRWIATGTLDDVALSIREENIARQKLARSVLGNAQIAADNCGFHIWLRMPPHWRAADFVDHAGRSGISVVPGAAFAIGPAEPEALRLSLGVAPDREALVEALKQVANLVSQPAVRREGDRVAAINWKVERWKRRSSGPPWFQAAPVLFDTPATLLRLEGLVRQAAEQKADIAVFPEAFVGGYPKGLDFGARLGMRSAEGRDAYRRYFESAITALGPECAKIGEMARSSRMHLVVGVIERGGSTLYCTALVFGPDGQLLGKHRKLMPTALERIVWGQGDGSTLAVVDSEIGRIGSVICWENYMPLLRMAMYAQGVEIIARQRSTTAKLGFQRCA